MVNAYNFINTIAGGEFPAYQENKILALAKSTARALARRAIQGMMLSALISLGYHFFYSQAQVEHYRNESSKNLVDKEISERARDLKSEYIVYLEEKIMSYEKPIKILPPGQNFLVGSGDEFISLNGAAEMRMQDAARLYHLVYPKMTPPENLDFYRSADLDKDNYISVEEAKEFLQHIRSKYEKVVRKAWEELGR